MRLLRHPLIIAVAALALFFPGCYETDVWLPDSSGFLYLDPAGDPDAIWHYDLKLEKSRKIDAGGIISSNLDVSVDGQKIACLVRAKDGKGDDKEGWLVVLDFAGKELHRSKPFRFPKREMTVQNKEGKNEVQDVEPDFYANGGLEWFPGGDRILIGDGNAERGPSNMFHTTYNVDQSQLAPWKQGNAFLNIRRMGTCPRIIRPDGTGYYFTTTEGKEIKLFFQPTEGEKTQLKRFANDANFEKLSKEYKADPTHYSWRKDNKLIGAFFGSPVVEIDVDKAVVTLRLDNLEKVKKERRDKATVQRRFVFANQQIALLHVDAEAKDGGERLEIENIKEQNPTKLEFPAKNIERFMPSPDHNYVAVLCNKIGTKGQRYVIIDAQGQVYDEVLLTPDRGELVRAMYEKLPCEMLGLTEPLKTLHTRIAADGRSIEIDVVDATDKRLSFALDPDPEAKTSDTLLEKLRLPPRGPEESALYGLLLRWSAKPPDKTPGADISRVAEVLRKLDERFAGARPFAAQGADK